MNNKKETRGRGRSTLPAKLAAPKVDKAVPRARLFQLLDEARNKPVIWVGAPAGSGKTTLVASYLAERKIKPLWYQIDARDADPAAFFAYLRQAVGKLSRRKRETLPLLTPEYSLGIPTFTLNFFEQIFSRLRKPALLVFDNFQDLAETSPLHELLPEVVKVMPQNTNIIFISRTDIPECLASLRAKQQVARIDAVAMQLQSVEAHQIGEYLLHESVANERIESLNRQAGGWLAGLILLLEGADDRMAGKEINGTVFDYFAAEIMRRADEETQTFLASCSVLPVMDAETASALTGNIRAEVILKNLVRRNYFISRIPGEVMRYEFHPLFRDYLQEELCRRLSDEELRQLRRRAGLILTEQEEYADAVELLFEAGAIEELVVLVLGRAEAMVAEGRYQTLFSWLAAIPEIAYQQQPWLIFWLGISQMPADPQSAINCFEQTYEAFEKRHDVAGMYLSWAGIAESYTLQWDDFSPMHDWLQKLDALRKAHPDYPSPQIEAQVEFALYSVKLFMNPRGMNSQGMEDRLLNSSLGTDFRIKCGVNLAFFYSWNGKFDNMRRVMGTLEQLVKQGNVSPLSRILVTAHRGSLLWMTAEPEAACAEFLTALEIAEKSGVHILDAYLLGQLLYAKGILRDLEGMRQTLEIMKKCLHQQRRIDIVHYLFHLSWYKAMKGEHRDSLKIIHEGKPLIEQLSVQFMIAVGNVTLGKALTEAGDFNGAMVAFNKAIEFTQSASSRHMEYMARMLLSYMFLRQVKEQEAVEELSKALAIVSCESDFWTFPLWEDEVVSELCFLALQHDIERKYVHALIRKLNLLPPEGAPIHGLWPWHVRIYTLGRFALLIDGAPVKSSGKTLEMLKAIIAFGGRDVSDQKLCEALWPDAEGDLAYQNYKVTLHRLRKQIGMDTLVVQDGKLSFDVRYVWVDAWAFERLLGSLETATGENNIAGLVGEAIKLYNGAFLKAEGGFWALTMRERLRGKFLRVIDNAAKQMCAQTHCAEVLACYRKGIEIDPLAESFYQGQMQCHYCLKQPAEGLAVYQRCREILERELGVTPSSKTEALHAQLRQLSA